MLKATNGSGDEGDAAAPSVLKRPKTARRAPPRFNIQHGLNNIYPYFTSHILI
jgi:hypothetical protein